jgi:hypothetical protein
VIGMARKTLDERRSQKLAKLEELKDQIAKMEGRATKRFGMLSIRAGLSELNLSDTDLLRELSAIAARFRNQSENAASNGAHASLPGGQNGKEA